MNISYSLSPIFFGMSYLYQISVAILTITILGTVFGIAGTVSVRRTKNTTKYPKKSAPEKSTPKGNTPLDTFADFFQKLPAELRLIIWKEALPSQRIVPVLVNCYRCSYTKFRVTNNPSYAYIEDLMRRAIWTSFPEDNFFRAMEVPAILTVDKESREVGKKHYEVMYTNDGLFNMKVHIDYSTDIPFFNLEHRDDFYVLPEKAKLQRMAMKMPKYFMDDDPDWFTTKTYEMKNGCGVAPVRNEFIFHNRLPTPQGLRLFVKLKTIYLVLGESIFEQRLKPGQEVRFVAPTAADAKAWGGLKVVEKFEKRIAKRMRAAYPSPEKDLPRYKVVSCEIHTVWEAKGK